MPGPRPYPLMLVIILNMIRERGINVVRVALRQLNKSTLSWPWDVPVSHLIIQESTEAPHFRLKTSSEMRARAQFSLHLCVCSVLNSESVQYSLFFSRYTQLPVSFTLIYLFFLLISHYFHSFLDSIQLLCSHDQLRQLSNQSQLRQFSTPNIIEHCNFWPGRVGHNWA